MIPKIIHIAWNDKNVLQSNHPLIKNGLRNLKDLNPEWDVQINDDKEIDYYLKYNLTQNDYSVVKDIDIVPKTDIWRLLKIYNEGGLYVDIDRYCNISLDSFLTDNINWVLPVCDYQDFSHDFMMSSPYNPAFYNVISLYLKRRHKGIKNVYYLGAETYMHGVTFTFFNEIINVKPGKEQFLKLLDNISPMGFILYPIECPPSKTVIYDGGITFDDWAAVKKSFYAENNIKHWTGEW